MSELLQRPADLAPARPSELPSEEPAGRGEMSFLETLGGTFVHDTTIGAAGRALEDVHTPDQYFDPSWVKQLDTDYDKLMEGVPPELQVELADSQSLYEFERRKERVLDSLQFDDDVAASGATGFGTRIIGNFMEPTAWATGPIIGSLSMLNKGTRIQRALKTGAVVGVESAAIESLVASNSDTINSSDVLVAGLLGMGIGGAIGGLLPGQKTLIDDAVVRGVRSVGDDEARMASGFSDDSVGAAAPKGTGAAAEIRDDEKMLQRLGLDDDATIDSDTGSAVFSGGRFDISGILGGDEDEAVRALGKQLVEDPVSGNRNGASASEVQTFVFRTLLSEARRPAEPAFQAWARREGRARSRYNPFAQRTRDEFFRTVGRHIRTGDSTDTHVVAAARGYTKMFQKSLQELKAAGVKGFEDIPADPNYIPRIRNDAAIANLTSKYGATQIQELVYKAMRSSLPDIEESVVRKISKGYWRRLRSLSVGADIHTGQGLNLRDTDTIREILREGVTDDPEIDQIIDLLKDRTQRESKGGGSRSNARAVLDEGTTLAMRADDGTVRDVGIQELFEDNVELIAMPYVRTMAGWVGLAKSANIRSEADIKDTLMAIASRAEGMGAARAERVRKKILPRMEFLFDYLRGMPTHKNGSADRFFGMVRDYNFTRVMNQTGFAQIAEIGNIFAYAGLRGALKAIPALRQFSRDAHTGRLKLEEARMIEEGLNLGNERMINSPASRFDVDEFDKQRVGGLVETTLTAARNITSDVSGLAPMTAMLQQWSGGAITQRFLDIAHGLAGDIPAKRMESLGLRPERWAPVKTALVKYTKKTKRGVRTIDHEKWMNEDPGSFDTFRMAVFRASRRSVQENDVGATDVWMHSTFGRMLIQFRSFLLGSYSKQLLHSLHMRDRTAYMSMLATTLFGGVGYIARTYTNYWNNDEKRKKALDPWRIAGQSLYGSSVLGSGMTGASWLFNGPGLDQYMPEEFQKMMNIERSTNMASDAFFGNPTVDAAVSGFDLVQGLTETAVDTKTPSRDTYRAFHSLLPVLNNLSGVRNVHNAIYEQLPDEKY